MSQTAAFIAQLTNNRRFGPGERARLRALAGRGLDENTPGFDLFTGLWWPLRKRNQTAPRREIAWLIAKLYGAYPIPHVRPDEPDLRPTLPRVLGRCEPRDDFGGKRHRQRFDALLQSPLSGIEPHLRWALSEVRAAIATRRARGIDWVQLTDDLSAWDRGEEHRRRRDVRDEWAEQYLESTNQPERKEP